MWWGEFALHELAYMGWRGSPPSSCVISEQGLPWPLSPKPSGQLPGLQSLTVNPRLQKIFKFGVKSPLRI